MKKLLALFMFFILMFLVSCSNEQQTSSVESPEDTIMQEENEIVMTEEDIMLDDNVEARTQNQDLLVQEDAMEDSTLEVGTVEQITELSGTYADYDTFLVGATDETVLFFHASWCPSCTAADTGISAGTVPEGLTILKVDYDSEIELRKQYQVTTQHTFVQVDADGNEIKKWVGGTSVEDIVEKVQ